MSREKPPTVDRFVIAIGSPDRYGTALSERAAQSLADGLSSKPGVTARVHDLELVVDIDVDRRLEDADGQNDSG